MSYPTTIDEALAWRHMDSQERCQRQAALLQAHVRQALQAPFYKKLFAERGITAEDIQSLEDLARLPLTNRSDLDAHPHGFQAIKSAAVADLALTSGTTGSSVQIPYSQNDLQRLAFNEAMAFYGTGVRESDSFLLCVTLDRCFIAGLAYYSGLVQLGATAIRSGPGQPARQWELIRELSPTGIVGVPSFLLRLADWAKENGCFDPSSVHRLVTIGEPVRKADLSLTSLGKMLEETWGASVYSSHGATEIETAFCECSVTRGGHIHPELVVVEIIDEEGRVLPPGQPGELVVTPLGVEGFPLLRFRTGDVARLHTEPCACGWTTPRLGPVEGRLAQRLKYRGTTLYPETIFQTLQELDAGLAAFVEVHSSYDLSDEVRVVIGAGEPEACNKKQIADLLQARLRVLPEIEVRPRSEVLDIMQQTSGSKMKKFFDLRQGSIS